MSKKGMINIAGASDSRLAPIISHLLKDRNGQSLIVVPSVIRARHLAVDLSFFTERKIYVLPEEEDSFMQYEAANNDSLLERLSILKAAVSGEECIIIAPVTGAIRKLPPAETFMENSLQINLGDDIDVEQVKAKLYKMGYERVPIIEGRGEFSIRGGIIDVFTPDSDSAYRIELFDTEVDSIRTFDIDTQRSDEPLKYVRIYQCSQITRDTDIFAEGTARIEKAYDRQIKKAQERGDIVSVNHRITAFLESYFDVIFALNRQTHPGEKRQVQLCKKYCTLLPKDFEENINALMKSISDGGSYEIVTAMVNNLDEILNDEFK